VRCAAAVRVTAAATGDRRGERGSRLALVGTPWGWWWARSAAEGSSAASAEVWRMELLLRRRDLLFSAFRREIARWRALRMQRGQGWTAWCGELLKVSAAALDCGPWE